jgi:hypothetical protein
MKETIDVTIINAIKQIVEGTGDEVTYHLEKEAILPIFEGKTWFERILGIRNDRREIYKTTLTIKITERL